jgi:hypothetical protein
MPKRGMEAVASKQQDMQSKLREKLKRKPIMQRKGKGPGVAVMIAIGKPKGEMGGMGKMGEEKSMREELDASKGEGMSKADKIAALEEKIGYLKAELALLKDENDEMDEEMDNEDESEDDSEDSEDEYED